MSVTLAILKEPVGLTNVTAFDGTDSNQKIRRVYFQVTPSNNPANYAGAPGDTMDFTTLGDIIKTEFPPLVVIMYSAKSGGSSGYDYNYVPNAVPTLQNGTFQVLQCGGATAPMADIGAGAYPAGVLGDTVIGYADFLKL